MSRTKSSSRSARSGFSLVEVMIAAGLSGFILVAILSAFLMIGRSGYNASNYCTMEAEARRALERFSQEARLAKTIVWNSANSVTLTVISSSGNYDVTYAYDTSANGATAKSFYRLPGAAASTSTRLVLVRNVTDFAFRRYKVVNGVDYSAANELETKQIQITLRATRSGVTTVDATNAVLSARVVLRNKPVST
jgi:Tfp pilus assembly protein PilW